MHINEVSKRLYPRISRNSNFGPIFPGKKCGLSAGKYGTLRGKTLMIGFITLQFSIVYFLCVLFFVSV